MQYLVLVLLMTQMAMVLTTPSIIAFLFQMLIKSTLIQMALAMTVMLTMMAIMSLIVRMPSLLIQNIPKIVMEMDFQISMSKKMI